MSRPPFATLVLLTIPPLVWASNAVIGRFAVAGQDGAIASPIALNALRWALALAILVLVFRPWAGTSARKGAAAADSMAHRSLMPSRQQRLLAALADGGWRRFALFGLLSVTLFNTMQYTALRTSSAINVTLIAASGPFFMLLLGRFFFGDQGTRWAWLGAALSLIGVAVVLTGGNPGRIAQLEIVPGDGWMLLATVVWSLYSWLLRRYRPSLSGWDFMLLQVGWGALLSLPLVAGEWAADALVVRMQWSTLAVVAWIATGPSLLAYWCWDRGISRAGPVLPMFFLNLTPLFAALMSAALIGEPPRLFHGAAFGLILAGIALSQRGRPTPVSAPVPSRSGPAGHRR